MSMCHAPMSHSRLQSFASAPPQIAKSDEQVMLIDIHVGQCCYQSQKNHIHSTAHIVIGIDHDRVCAGVVGTAIRNSTSCAGRRAAASGRAGRHNECCSGLQYQPRQHRPYKWSISILPRSQFTKSKRNLRFRRLVPLFVPIGVCVTTHDDGTASDVTIT